MLAWQAVAQLRGTTSCETRTRFTATLLTTCLIVTLLDLGQCENNIKFDRVRYYGESGKAQVP
jgi:hypothetical protein